MADRDRREGKTGAKGELLRMKRNIQMHLHTSASPRLYKERNGTPRISMTDHVERKLAPLPPYTPRKYAAERLLPRNLIDIEDDEGPQPQPSDSVFSRPNRSAVCSTRFKGAQPMARAVVREMYCTFRLTGADCGAGYDTAMPCAMQIRLW